MPTLAQDAPDDEALPVGDASNGEDAFGAVVVAGLGTFGSKTKVV